MFLKHRNQVIVRFRWCKKNCEVAFSAGLHAGPLKWKEETQRLARGSTHIICHERNLSRVINDRMKGIDYFFSEYALADIIPSANE